VPGVDQYDIIAVIVGVMFTMRKLDTQSRNPTQSPNVDPEDFLRWQRRSAAAYAPGAYASFFRVLFHFGFMRYAVHHPLPPLTFARVALLVDALWVGCTIYTLVNAHFAREMRKKLGISLDKPQPTR
jgi:hypothetical protein